MNSDRGIGTPVPTADQRSHFRWPAEWEPQECIWLAWPHNQETWGPRFASIPHVFQRLASMVSEVVPVRILAEPKIADLALSLVGNLPNLSVVDCPTNDCWIRDFGPTFVQDTRDGTVLGIDWKFNAWGEKYPPWDADAAAAETICQVANCKRIISLLTLEGGAIETDGQDRLLTTTTCTLSKTRNLGWTSESISREMHRCLGVREILWLDGGGLEGDDTDGHIDQLARFVDPENVVAAISKDSLDPNHLPLDDNFRQLRIWGRQTTPPVTIHPLPIPPRRTIDGQRVPESYCNFLIAGGKRVIVPQFGAKRSDRVAVSILRELIPSMDVIGMDAADLIWGLGAFHCVSQTQPATSIDA